MMWTLWPLGVAHEYTSIIDRSSLSARPRCADSSGTPSMLDRSSACSPDQARRGPDWQRGRRAWAQSQRLRASSARATARASSSTAASASTPWRLEWGPSQRPYIEGQELRLRMELGLPPDLQMLVIRAADGGAREAGLRAVHRGQRRRAIDAATPEEMRWLVMFPKLADATSSQTLRDTLRRASPACRTTAAGTGSTARSSHAARARRAAPGSRRRRRSC